jgi:putative copper resistance protein D
MLLTQTQFGLSWIARGAGFVLLAIALATGNRHRVSRLSAVALGLALSGSLAWSGHGGATPGAIGDLHLTADILHLLASGI